MTAKLVKVSKVDTFLVADTETGNFSLTRLEMICCFWWRTSGRKYIVEPNKPLWALQRMPVEESNVILTGPLIILINDPDSNTVAYRI